jgi:hypothetical protein
LLTTRLDEWAAPTAAVDLNGQRIANVDTPSLANDAANKAYVDANLGGNPNEITDSDGTTKVKILEDEKFRFDIDSQANKIVVDIDGSDARLTSSAGLIFTSS